MHSIRVSTDLLIKLLGLCKPLLSRASIRPVLTHVLFNEGRMTATNLQSVVVGRLHVQWEECPGFTLPGKELFMLLKAQGQETTLFNVDEALQVMVNGVKLQSLPAEEFPVIESLTGQKVYLAASDLGKLVEVSMAASKDTCKGALQGVYLHPQHPTFQSPAAFATDGHRLNMSPVSYAGPEVVLHSEWVGLMAKAFLKKRPRFAFDGNIKISKGWIHCLTDDVRISSKLLEGAFPEVQRVIPDLKSCEVTSVVLPDDFLAQLKPGVALISDKFTGIQFEVNGSIDASITIPHLGEWKATLQGTEKSGVDCRFSLNAGYLRDAFEAAGKTGVTIHAFPEEDGTVTSPILFRNSQGVLRSLVMPMLA